jgi:hypothetical protein
MYKTKQSGTSNCANKLVVFLIHVIWLYIQYLFKHFSYSYENSLRECSRRIPPCKLQMFPIRTLRVSPRAVARVESCLETIELLSPRLVD